MGASLQRTAVISRKLFEVTKAEFSHLPSAINNGRLLTVGRVTHVPSPRCNVPASPSRAVTGGSRGENL